MFFFLLISFFSLSPKLCADIGRLFFSAVHGGVRLSSIVYAIHYYFGPAAYTVGTGYTRIFGHSISCRTQIQLLLPISQYANAIYKVGSCGC